MLSAGGSSESAQVWALSNYFSNLVKQLYKSMLVFFPFPSAEARLNSKAPCVSEYWPAANIRKIVHF